MVSGDALGKEKKGASSMCGFALGACWVADCRKHSIQRDDRFMILGKCAIR